ncbi:lipopolysaccharide biosynthesis protein [Sphingomicrobium nitratireducens]|uniref:lipopolysaccharide biosynthesis protein n=1 Tax=Sphingomicrobium nitratireducens TaxID=2964666 RepID=UPI00223FED22
MSAALQRVGKNFSLILSGKTVGALLSLAYLAIAARVLGPRDFGVLALMHAAIMFIGGIVAFSGWQTLVRFGQAPLREDDREGLASVIRLTALIEAAMALVAILAAAIALPIAAREGGWGPVAEQYAPFYALAILATARQTPFGLLQLFRRFDWLGAHAAVMPLVRFLGTLAVVATGGGLGAFILVWMAAAAAEGLSLWAMAGIAMARRSIAWPTPRRVSEALRLFPGIGRYAFVSNADYTLVNITPLAIPLLVGAVLGPTAAGLFALATRATNALQQPAQLAAQSSFEVVADLASRQQWAELRAMLWKGGAIAIGAGGIVALLFVASGETVMAVFGGPEFAAAGSILALVAIARALAMAQPGLAATLGALGRPGVSLVISVSVGLAALAAMVAGMLALGLDGVGYAMIGQSLAATLLAAVATAKVIGIEERRA